MRGSLPSCSPKSGAISIILKWPLRLLRFSVELAQVGKLLGYPGLQAARRRPVPIHFGHAFRKIMLVRSVGVRLVVSVAVFAPITQFLHQLGRGVAVSYTHLR